MFLDPFAFAVSLILASTQLSLSAINPPKIPHRLAANTRHSPLATRHFKIELWHWVTGAATCGSPPAPFPHLKRSALNISKMVGERFTRPASSPWKSFKEDPKECELGNGNRTKEKTSSDELPTAAIASTPGSLGKIIASI
jgi:hypothetical protein